MKEIEINVTENTHKVLFEMKQQHGYSAKDLLLKGALSTGLLFRCEQCGKLYFHDCFGEQTSDGCDICKSCHSDWIEGKE